MAVIGIVLVCAGMTVADEGSQASGKTVGKQHVADEGKTPATKPAETSQAKPVSPAVGSSQPAEKGKDLGKSEPQTTLFGEDQQVKQLGRRNDSTRQLMTQMVSLVVVILILGGLGIVVAKKVLPRLKGHGLAEKQVKLLETTYVTSRHAVHLVQVGKMKLLMASSKDGLRMMQDVSEGFDREIKDFSEVLEKNIASDEAQEDKA